MKNIIITYGLLILSFASVFSQEKRRTIGQIDKAIINLFHASQNEDYKSSLAALKTLDTVWSNDKFKILDNYQCSPYQEVQACVVDGFVALLYTEIDLKDFVSVNNYTRELRSVFLQLKESQELTGDPVDILWEMYFHHQDVHETVHDLMFGLREWFEFEDMVKGFSDDINLYNALSEKEIQAYFPSLDVIVHADKLEKLNNCFLNFLLSLESGYRTDFEWPCDELGMALYEMILLYGNVHT